jgi:hypothetical protein
MYVGKSSRATNWLMPRKKTDFEVQEKDTEKEYLDTI